MKCSPTLIRNEILAASVSNDPNVLVSKCLDAAREAHITRGAAGRTARRCRRCLPGNIRRFSLCMERFLRHDSHVLRVTRSLASAVMAIVAAAAIGLASSIYSPACASATTASAMTDTYTRPPSPVVAFITPLTIGLHVIDAIAEGIANAVELIATPPPIAIPAPQTGT